MVDAIGADTISKIAVSGPESQVCSIQTTFIVLRELRSEFLFILCNCVILGEHVEVPWYRKHPADRR